ncbi:PLP-dependent aminotransferase family protein [Chloroflexota bacterium]
MDMQFAKRMRKIQKSFIREILKTTVNPDVISFAGGLPNPETFPVEGIKQATAKVLEAEGENALQYSTTEGYLPLRQYIADRYKKRLGLTVSPDEILIIHGSQQGLDLLGKVFLDKGDKVLIERPGYLGAIQAFSVFESDFHSIPLIENGIDTEQLEKAVNKSDFKLFYGVPNFQNPSGITYSEDTRVKTAAVLNNYSTVFIEDDPYSELRFIGEDLPSIKKYLGDKAVLMGSFSKIVSPGIRVGWIQANKEVMEQLITVKQASDLHTSSFTQMVLYQYLADNDIDVHIDEIRQLYKKQRDCMVGAIGKYFPTEVKTTKPEGGMFLWATLPEGMSSMDLFTLAAGENVAFVPGNPFYADVQITNTLRLNYTNSSEEKIEEGIKRLGEVIKKLL